MIEYYKSTKEGKLIKNETLETGSWVNLIRPDANEIEYIVEKTCIDPDFIRAALDEEERSRIEVDDDSKVGIIIVDTPYLLNTDESKIIETYPVGIIHCHNYIITVSSKENPVLNYFINNTVKTFFTFKKSRFILQILYRNTLMYLRYLKLINKLSSTIESELHKSMKNKDLMKLLDLEKSLVYISTSIKSNELVFEKLIRLDFIDKYDEDTELIEDIIVENKQGMEMSKIYSDILSETRDAFSSVINNNLNTSMRFLAIITMLMSVSTVVSGFFGMNVKIPNAFTGEYGFYLIVFCTLLSCLIFAIIMKVRNLF